MKSLGPILIIVAVVVLAIFVFKGSKTDSTNNNIPAPQISGNEVSEDFSGRFVFDINESEARWTGSKKIIKDYYDKGSIKIKSGEVVFEAGSIKSGEVVFDMISISGETTSHTSQPVTRLTEHLKSADFFEVETYPEAKYIVTGSEKTNGVYMLTGDLTLKGKTNPLNIFVNAVMTQEGNVLIAGITDINRATWDVRFGSESFFNDLGDNIINDIFTLEFKVVAKP